ncbi:NACHT domain-containing protein [Vibrio campbellii]|uniref:NACHT N-terminal Helical domain 1-containing protein n=1 Tax=Vibrio campbellii TaxID=680 RepID=UPI0002AE4724|nr:NACHT domain-containing protein [Vibrio campbellii]ARV72205.1 hypothetical protein A8140_05575 [Vibrio campbellii CAIM 519 = NBRC 15631 = ATCC 25920]ELU50363.1 large ATP-binding protein [Vibrio campbellii CAIM 519 = NBRC 15631 = ATCC 25920]
MPIFEGFLALSSVLCKTGFQIIAGQNILAQQASAELIDLIRKKIPNSRQAGRLNRLLEGVADEAAECLQTLSESEEFKLPENEKLATIHAVQLTIEKAELNFDKVIKVNMSAEALEKQILSSGKVEYDSLTSSSQQYFDILLRDSCAITVEIVKGMPNINVLISSELLRRTDEFLDKFKDLLSELSTKTVSIDQKDKDFETRYLRSIATKLNSYSLFGLDVDASLKKLDLDISYISLTGSPSYECELESTQIEHILSQANAAIISGSPGSGKTTLLHWLALNASKHTFEGELDRWNGFIPFIIPLRKYSKNELPKLSDFVEFASRLLVDTMPEGWVDRVLSTGKAMILIDGLDEVSREKRAEVQNWIDELLSVYTDCFFIVTSRPNALDEDWLYYAELAHVELQPMTPDNIAKFIDNWHLAVAQVSNKNHTEAELSNFKKRLKVQINENSRLRNMASSPLLCAMLCALNIDRNAMLPQEKGELYRVVMEVLLERRDSERKIEANEGIVLTRAQKELLLQNLAYWMLINRKQTASFEEAEDCFRRTMKSMPNVKGTEKEVTQYLLARSAVIRETSVGYIDFVHKTFSEYLAAKHLVEEDCISMIADNAHNEDWKEVVVMASMHTSRKDSNALISKLIQTGDSHPQHKYTLHLLAVVAKETTITLDKDVADQVDKIVASLLPPRDKEAALSISSAGEFAAPYLRFNEKHSTKQQKLSIETLVLINGDSAIEALSSYSKSSSHFIHQELIEQWAYFEEDKYAERVVSQIKKIDSLIWPVKTSLKGVESLRNVKHLHLNDLWIDDHEYERLSALNLKRLQISHCTDLYNLNFLAGYTELCNLEITECHNLSCVSALTKLANIELLTLSDCTSIKELPNLQQLSKLSALNIEGNSEIKSLLFLEKHPSIVHLNIDNCIGITTLQPLSQCKKLTDIQTDNLSLSETLPDHMADHIW